MAFIVLGGRVFTLLGLGLFAALAWILAGR
jgi:hypothetical protein